MPDSAKSYVRRRNQNPHVCTRVALTQEWDEQRAGDNAEGPVQVACHQRNRAGQRYGLHWLLGVGKTGEKIEGAVDRARGDTRVGRNQRDAELHREL